MPLPIQMKFTLSVIFFVTTTLLISAMGRQMHGIADKGIHAVKSAVKPAAAVEGLAPGRQMHGITAKGIHVLNSSVKPAAAAEGLAPGQSLLDSLPNGHVSKQLPPPIKCSNDRSSSKLEVPRFSCGSRPNSHVPCPPT